MGSYNPEFVENEFEKLKKYIKNKNILRFHDLLLIFVKQWLIGT